MGGKKTGRAAVVYIVCKLSHGVGIFQAYSHLRVWMPSLILREEESSSSHPPTQSCHIRSRAQIVASEHADYSLGQFDLPRPQSSNL